MQPEPTYQHDQQHKIGVLLINLGTPDAPTEEALRPYLKQFLSDTRVIEMPRWLWWPILHGIILTLRPAKSAEKYKLVWMPEGSPLKVHTQRQTKLLATSLAKRAQVPLVVEYAMNVGSPSFAEVFTKMKDQGCERILAIPLFPQYASSSTGAAMSNIFSLLKEVRNLPEIRTIKQYHDNPDYIAALARNINEYWQSNGRPDKLIMSFHGIPQESIGKGDPYYHACHETGQLLAKVLALNTEQYQVSFQSRFGRAKWLTPYTSTTLEKLGKDNTTRVDIVCPGFVSDCLETLEEIAIEAKATFINAGGQEFHYIPCLNENEDWIQALSNIAYTHLQGWLGQEPPH